MYCGHSTIAEADLPAWLRFPDLKARGTVRNRTTLTRWIETQGFPPGVLLGPNTRAWPADEVEEWERKRREAARAEHAA